MTVTDPNVSVVPDDGAAPPRDAVVHDLAERLGATVARRLDRTPTLDVARLGVPDLRDALRRPGGAGAGTVAVRLYRATVIVAGLTDSEGPCPTCLDVRWTACRPRAERQLLDEPYGVLRPSDDALLTGPAHAVLDELVTTAALTPVDRSCAAVWELDLRTLRVSRMALLRDSSCPACARPVEDGADAARIALRPQPTVRAGEHRLRSPESYRLPLDALVNPVCGMLGASGLRAYHCTATAPVSGFFEVRSKYGLHEMWWSGHTESYGRSELLGVFEGLERHAGQHPRRRAVAVRATAGELTDPFLDLADCGLYTDRFYDAHEHQYVRWGPDVSIPWVWGWSLRDQQPLLVPEQVAYYLDHRRDHRNTVQECSNGCASGASTEEAVLHGLLELLERDAFLLSWYAGVTPPEIDLDTVDSPLVRHMRERLDLLGYDLRCFDVRADVPVPVVGAVAVRRVPGPGNLCFAGGAGFDPEDAVRAAVCEVASYVPGFDTRVTGEHDELLAMVDDYSRVTELKHHALLFGMPEMAAHAQHWLRQDVRLPLGEVYRDWTDVHRPGHDLTADVRTLVDLLAGIGSDVVVVDQTTPEQAAFGLHTVATIAPTLVPIDFGWTRQRVLHLPRLRWAHHLGGRTDRPRTRADLVLVPHPFP
jgi:ribosomal protein S12 methylthiotransferase accessory factor